MPEPSVNLELQDLLAEVDRRDQPLLARARDFCREQSGAAIRDTVRSAKRRRGIDFATAVLYSHFVDRLQQDSRHFADRPHGVRTPSAAPKIVVAPGAFHREHPEAGGDGSQIVAAAEQRGWESEVLPTESLGTLDTNAECIVAWLERQPQRRCILVSLSKGSADVMVALNRRPDLHGRVQAWISISGVLQGSPMSNWLLHRKFMRLVLWFMLWKHQADVQAIRDLQTGPRERLPVACHQLSAHQPPFPIFHIAGFPLKRHLSNGRAKLWHRRLKRGGPNDSVVLLEDLLDCVGTVIPVWGADHYLKSRWNAIASLTSIVESVAENDGPPL